MAFPWSVISFLFRVMGPSIPDILSTINKLKTQQRDNRQEATDNTHNTDTRFTEIDRTLSLQLELIDQLTSQLRDLEKISKKAMALSLLTLAVAVLTLGVLFLHSPT